MTDSPSNPSGILVEDQYEFAGSGSALLLHYDLHKRP